MALTFSQAMPYMSLLSIFATYVSGHPQIVRSETLKSSLLRNWVLDAETEAAFWASLEKSESKPTTVVVTHRISTIERSDAVVVMEKGEVVQYGSFGDLQREGDVFARVYKRCLL